MMHFLKRRTVAQAPSVDSRRVGRMIFRWLYLAGVLGLAVWLFTFYFSGLLFFQSDGLVLGEPAVVAAEFTATVQDLAVEQGDTVNRGEVAATVSSQSVTETIARLTAEIATLQARRGERSTRGVVVDKLLELAQNRQKVATAARERLESAQIKGYLPLNPRTAAVDLEYRSYEELETLRAEKSVISSEIATLSTALAQAEKALDDLRKLYDGGRLRIPIDGVVSRVVAQKGAVVRAGEPIVELYGNRRFILAYIPTGRLYSFAVGDAVNIRIGFQTSRGRITRVEPVAATLPREFQRAFSPIETQQVIRVDFAPNETPPPLFTKVSLTATAFWR